MASFGEALVGAFNQTYGTMNRSRLQNAQADALELETRGQREHQRVVTEEQQRRGLVDQQGFATSASQMAARAGQSAAPIADSEPTAESPAPARRGNLGRAAAPPPSPALAAASPTRGGVGPAVTENDLPPAVPSNPAVPPQPPAPVAGPAAPGAPGVSRPPAAPQATPDPGRPGAPGPMPGAPAQTAPTSANDGMPPGQYDPNSNLPTTFKEGPTIQPPIPREAVEEASRLVTARGDKPVDAMVVAGAMAPHAQRGPGQRQAAEYAPQLVQEIMQTRGEGARGPLTRQDWDGYLTSVTLSAQRNLSPRDQVQQLAVVDRIRQAGLQRFTALAVASAQAGDMEGAARALNGASNFNPDGYQDTFRATNGGIEMVRRPEPGVNGRETRVTVPAAEVVRYATAMLDPSWSLNHFLNVARHEETVRHNQAGERLQAASIASAAADRRERRTERREGEEADGALARARTRMEDAQDALHEAQRAGGDNPNPEQRAAIERARQAYTEARTARDQALSGRVTQRGLLADNTIGNTRGDDRRSISESDRRRAGQAPFTSDERREATDTEGAFRDAHTSGRGTARRLDLSADYALQRGRQVWAANRDMGYQQVLEGLRDFRANPDNWQIGEGSITNRQTGLTLQVPRTRGSAPRSNPPPSDANAPPARTDEGGGSAPPARPAATTSNLRDPGPARPGGGTPEMREAESRAGAYHTGEGARSAADRRAGNLATADGRHRTAAQRALRDATEDARALIQQNVPREQAIREALGVAAIRRYGITRQQLEAALGR